MQTYSHLLLTAVLHIQLRRQGHNPHPALLAGAVLPDVPLALLTVAYVADRRVIRPHLPDKTRCSPTYNELYFNHPGWIAAHNLLHAPLPLLIYTGVGHQGVRAGEAWGRLLTWFALGCGLHSAIDVLTHADDGPVVGFPLNWRYRISAPVSYWDPKYGARWFRVVEHLLDLLLLLLLWRQWRGRWSQGQAQ